MAIARAVAARPVSAGLVAHISTLAGSASPSSAPMGAEVTADRIAGITAARLLRRARCLVTVVP
ncbi:hypothetical protein [Nocardia vaccinii]|uniref:hypothetical protein n=1 Tax=Nocardia vaccinii TaxID=1822 RepID=UPI0012F48A60|nr:hypothetical protein [Nocardia vaccinii]